MIAEDDRKRSSGVVIQVRSYAFCILVGTRVASALGIHIKHSVSGFCMNRHFTHTTIMFSCKAVHSREVVVPRDNDLCRIAMLHATKELASDL